MKSKIIISEKDGIVRYGCFADGQPVELYCEQKQRQSLLGNIYAARVERVADGIGGAFLEIAEGKKCYYRLPKNGQPIKLSPGHADRICGGDILLVQIVKDAVKTKLPVADSNISLTGKYFVLTLGDERFGVSKKIRNTQERERLLGIATQYHSGAFGIVVRTNAEQVPKEELVQELDDLVRKYQELMRKANYAKARSLLYQEPPYYITFAQEWPEQELESIVTDNPAIYENLREYYETPQNAKLFNILCLYTDSYPLEKLYRLDHFYEQATQKYVWLSSGGSLVIEPTEAMVVIDVNSGSVTKKKSKAASVYYQINQEAAAEIAKQLRLRNLSGMIVIDFINMDNKEQRKELLSYLAEECKKDRIGCQVIDITALGLVEMIRRKERKPLHEQLRAISPHVISAENK